MSDHDHAVVDPDDAEDTYAGTDVPGECRRLTGALGCEQLAGDATKIDDFWTE